MRLLNPLSAALALLTLSAEAKPRDAILLSQVESLTLRGDRQTTHRRVPAAPQLKCISAPALCARHRVDVMRCDNRGAGYDGEDIQWTCSAQLPAELKLGSTDVACEGYASPDDPYVLKGSCGVEYRVALTPEGEERWPELAGGGGEGGGGGAAAADWSVYAFWVIFISILGYILYGIFMGAQAGDNEHRRHRAGDNYYGGGGGGGGPGGGDDGWGDDPPPPYPGTNNNNRKNQSKRSGGGTGQQQGWRPDGWSASVGAAVGAAAGYGAGRMGNNSSRASRGGNNYGSTWGGDNGGEGSSRSNSSTSSSSRYESTGFGSTSRR